MRHANKAWGLAAAVVVSAGVAAVTLTAQDSEAPATPQQRLATLAERAASDPRPDLFFEMGRLQFELGDPGAAFVSLAQAVKLAPQGHHVHTYFLHQLDKTAYKGRLELLEQLLKTAPDYPPLMERLGILYQGKGKDDQAEALFKRWVALRADNAEPHARLAEFYRATGKPRQAVPHFQKVREIMGESSYALRRLGVVHRELGNLDQSAELLSLAIDQVEAGDDLVALVELGRTQTARKRYADAVTALTKVVSLDTGSPAYRVLLAQAQASGGQNTAAKASFEAAIKLDKFNLEAQLGLGNLLLEMGDPKGALPHIREASSRNDRDPELHFLVGEVSLKAGDLAGAEREYQKLKRIGGLTLAKKLKALIDANPAP